MRLMRHMGHRIKQMIANNKYIEVDSKFLVLVFLLCLFMLCISSFSLPLSEQGNMVTLRTLFSSLLGFIIENVTNDGKNQKQKTTTVVAQKEQKNAIGFQNEQKIEGKYTTTEVMKKEDETSREEREKEIENELTKTLGQIDRGPRAKHELRVLLIGHVVLFIVVALVIGAFVGVDQSNQSLVILKNTAFACVGFLISAAKSKK